jgi:PAS domain S-box-containing protein
MEMPYMPHGHCYFWDPLIMWSHAISDGIIALAYTSIPITLLYIYLKRKRDFKYVWMMVLFAVFIFGCGLTHIMDVINIWEPYYLVDSSIRIITALASVGTAVALVQISPKIVAIPTADKWIEVNKELNRQIEELKKKDQTIESIKHFQVLAQTLPQLVWTVDMNGKATFFNDKWCQYSGIDDNENIYEVINKVIAEDQKPSFLDNLKGSLENGELFEMQILLKNSEGDYRWFLGRALPLISGLQNILWVFTFTDIHEQITRKNELEKKNEELIKINNDLDTFIYTASHDLKHPISNLEGLFQALKKPHVVGNQQLIDQLEGMIETSIVKLKMTIDDLSDVAKIQKNVDDVKIDLNLTVITNEVLEDMTAQIENTNADISYNFQVEEVLFSTKNLRSIIYNLVSNAIKYKHPDRNPKINISSRREGNYNILEVNDNGLGIDIKYKEKLFLLFKRFHNHVEGTGIGLYIVKRIVENNGGKVEVDSEVDKGTTFKVYIPAIS